MNAAFAAWLDTFFATYYRLRPVNATFAGIHDYDDRLPDLSEAGQVEIATSSTTLLAQLRELCDEPLTPVERLDRDLAQGFLEIATWEASSAHFAWGNPSLFTGEAVFGVLSLLLRDFAPLDHRLDLAAERLDRVPRLLADGMASLHDAPRAWCQRARRECAGARLLLTAGISRLLQDHAVHHAQFERAAARAAEAFVRFDAFVEADLLPHSTEHYACGAQPFDLLLRHAHFLPFDADELERRALDRIALERAALAAAGPVPSNPSPEKPAYPDRYTELWQAACELAERADMLTIPDWPVHYVQQPDWVRDSAPAFYFLPYRSPPVFDHVPVVDYFAPVNVDDSTIKLNHVIHHGSWGHHVQNWHARRAASRIGQVAATDGASRIAMLCGGTMAEGWACYATDLADEAGFLSPAESIGQHAAHIRMAARAVVDVRLHDGRFSLEDAAAFYREQVAMAADAAMSEAVKNSLFPGAACMYLAGWEGIGRLRRELTGQAGPSLRRFHDQLLALGSVPVALAGRLLQETGAVSEYHLSHHGPNGRGGAS